MSGDELLEAPLYGLPQAEKDRLLFHALSELDEVHRQRCPEYRRIAETLWADRKASTLAELPWLPVGLFKSRRLLSVPEGEVTSVLTSSGTSGQVPSRIYLDKDTARRQSRALVRIMEQLLGPKRLPMLVVDSRALLSRRESYSARAAGVLGMMNFGSQPTFVLDEELRLDRESLLRFLGKHGTRPFLVFGFTFMVWAYLVKELEQGPLDLSQGILVHSGGWKKLHELSVDDATFRRTLREVSGLTRSYNFYGMVEQVGSVFLEGEDGRLYAPAFADVVIRHPLTLLPQPVGEPGVVQVVSALPRSYPGHSLLTEDLGVIEQVDVDSCGRLGKAFRILGRVPKAELRGCSDTHAAMKEARG